MKPKLHKKNNYSSISSISSDYNHIFLRPIRAEKLSPDRREMGGIPPSRFTILRVDGKLRQNWDLEISNLLNHLE